MSRHFSMIHVANVTMPAGVATVSSVIGGFSLLDSGHGVHAGKRHL